MHSCATAITQLLGLISAGFVYRLGEVGLTQNKGFFPFFIFLLFLLKMISSWVYRCPKLRPSIVAIFSTLGNKVEWYRLYYEMVRY